jgi:hypothetical protein
MDSYRELQSDEYTEPLLHSARLFAVHSVRNKDRINSHVKSGNLITTSFLKESLDSARLSSIAGCPVVHESRKLDGSLWEEVQDGSLRASLDLSPAVLRALGQVSHSKALSDRIPGIKLTAKGIRLLNGRYATPGGNPQQWEPGDKLRYRPDLDGLSIKLTKAAQDRLKGSAMTAGSQQELFLDIKQVSAIFPSRYCMLIAELEVSSNVPGALSPLVIEEALHVLSKRSRTGECSLASLNNGPGIDLHDLLEATVPEQRFIVDDRLRVFHYAALVLDRFPDDPAPIEALAFRCARHYTSDYDIVRDEVGKSLYRPFETVVHAFALEGAASIANGSDLFLHDQFLSHVKQVYLWLVVLAYHEQSYLLELVHRENFLIGTPQRRAEEFRKLIDDFLEFRLRHRMPLVSHIEMHNQAYHALRHHLRLDELIQKVTHDVVEAERWLTLQLEHSRQHERERRRMLRRRWGWLEIAVSSFLMFGLTYLSFDALIHRLALAKWNTDLPYPLNFAFPICIALFGAGLRGWQIHHEIYEDPIIELEQESTSTGEAAGIEQTIGAAIVRERR